MSLPALINRLSYPVLGKFSNEVKTADLRSAKVIIIDIHWYLSVPSAIKLSKKYRSINPKLSIIAGGISASIFADRLLQDSEIDYIIRGDAEIPLPLLVQSIMENSSPESVPNVQGKDFKTSSIYRVTEQDLNLGNYRNIQFFPSLQKGLYQLHKQSKGQPFSTYPYIMSFRGCPMPCDSCYGSAQNQKRAFFRKWVQRKATQVQEDLTAWSEDPHIHYVNSYHDFLTMLPAQYSEEILSKSFKLHIFFELYRLPELKRLKLLLRAFKGGIIMFSLDEFHSTSQHLSNPKLLSQAIQTVQSTPGFSATLSFVKQYTQENEAYKKALEFVHDTTKVRLNNAQFWWEHNPLPNVQGKGSEKDYHNSFLGRGKQFFWFNLMFQTGVRVHRYFPRFARFVADKVLSI